VHRGVCNRFKKRLEWVEIDVVDERDRDSRKSRGAAATSVLRERRAGLHTSLYQTRSAFTCMLPHLFPLWFFMGKAGKLTKVARVDLETQFRIERAAQGRSGAVKHSFNKSKQPLEVRPLQQKARSHHSHTNRHWPRNLSMHPPNPT
jgi:hypothetical protein